MKSALIVGLIFTSGLAFADDLQNEKKLSAQYVESMKQEPNATVVEENVVLRPIFESSSGSKPSANSKVEVLYEGFDRTGVVFDSAFKRDQTAVFPLTGVIKCWQVAVPHMAVGSVYKVTCPSETAYGDKGAGKDIKPGAAISFRIVLLAIK